MKNNRTNSLVICKDNYRNNDEFKNAIRDAIMLLLDAEYIMTIKYDEKGLGIVNINYQHDNEGYGCAFPYWLYPEEEETVAYNKD